MQIYPNFNENLYGHFAHNWLCVMKDVMMGCLGIKGMDEHIKKSCKMYSIFGAQNAHSISPAILM